MKVLFVLCMFILCVEAKKISLDEMKKEQRVAFVIENIDYEGMPKKTGIDSLDGIEKFLQKNGFDVIYKKNSNRSDTIRSFRTFNLLLKKGGVALFYFKGHAVQKGEKNYLLPVDIRAHGSKGVSKVLSINDIINIMNRAHSRVNMLIIDSVQNKTLSKELGILKSGLSAFRLQNNTDLIVSSQTNSASKSKNFTKKFKNIFKEKGLSNKDGFIRFKKENARTYMQLSHQDFYFKLPSKLLNQDTILWKKSVGLASLSSFGLYLKKYPKGRYSAQAQKQIHEIELKNIEIKKEKDLKEAKKKAILAAVAKRLAEVELAKVNLAKKKEHLGIKKIPAEHKLYKPAPYVKPEMVQLSVPSNEKSFSIGKYELSNKEYKAFLQATQNNINLQRYEKSLDEPVINVSFLEAKEYAVWLSAMSGEKYSLPTQQQWEYAARAGSDTKYFWGNKDVSMKKAYWLQDKANNAHVYAWIKSNAGKELHNIGQKEQNPWGLYDIYGNANEWCINTNENEEKQVLRGGSFLSSSQEIRTDVKVYKEKMYKSTEIGFRLVRELK